MRRSCVVEMFSPGKVTNFSEENIYIFATVKNLKSRMWPEKPHLFQYKWSDVLGGINSLKLVLKQGFYSIPEL
jgi:hypothetical protein